MEKVKIILEEKNNTPRIKVGDIDITHIIQSYEIFRDSKHNYLKLTIPIEEEDISIINSL